MIVFFLFTIITKDKIKSLLFFLIFDFLTFKCIIIVVVENIKKFK